MFLLFYFQCSVARFCFNYHRNTLDHMQTAPVPLAQQSLLPWHPLHVPKPFSWLKAWLDHPSSETSGFPQKPTPQHLPSLCPVLQGAQQSSLLHIGDLFSSISREQRISPALFSVFSVLNSTLFPISKYCVLWLSTTTLFLTASRKSQGTFFQRLFSSLILLVLYLDIFSIFLFDFSKTSHPWIGYEEPGSQSQALIFFVFIFSQLWWDLTQPVTY